MALLTSQQIASLNIGLFLRQIVLPQTVARVQAPSGGEGDTVTVRVQQPGSARVQETPGAAITYDDINETPVEVTLRHLYHGKRITAEEMTFDIVDFGAQISAIQVGAVAEGAEDELASVMNGLDADESFALEGSNEDTEEMVFGAREALSAANVPPGDRFLAVSPQIATRILKVLGGRETADTDSAIRAATIGQYGGFTVVESNALDSGTAVAYHRTGFAFGNRAPEGVRYANDTAVVTSGGIALRHIFQGQPDILSDASVVTTFAGANVTDEDRVFKFDTAAS